LTRKVALGFPRKISCPSGRDYCKTEKVAGAGAATHDIFLGPTIPPNCTALVLAVRIGWDCLCSDAAPCGVKFTINLPTINSQCDKRRPALGMRAHILSRQLSCQLKRQALFATQRRCLQWPIGGRPTSIIRHDFSSTKTASPLRQFNSKTRLFHSTSFRQEESTIYALSTAPGRAAIAVIRISGPACLQVMLPVHMPQFGHFPSI